MREGHKAAQELTSALGYMTTQKCELSRTMEANVRRDHGAFPLCSYGVRRDKK